MLTLVILGLLSATLQAAQVAVPVAGSSNSIRSDNEWTKACAYGQTANCTGLALQFGSRGLKVYIDTDNSSASFYFGLKNSSSTIGSVGWSKEGAFIEGCGLKEFQNNVPIDSINGLWDYFISDNALSVFVNQTQVLYYELERCAKKFQNQTLIPLFSSNSDDDLYWQYSKEDETGKDWTDIQNEDSNTATTIVLSDFATRGVQVYIDTDDRDANRIIRVFNQSAYIGYFQFRKDNVYIEGCGTKYYSQVGKNITGVWSAYITSRTFTLQFNYENVVEYDFTYNGGCADKWQYQDISGIIFKGFNDGGNKDYYKYGKEESSDNNGDYDLCSEGQRQVETNGKTSCRNCDRGEYGWNGQCNKCPPGKSTVNDGAKYEDCIDNRYIECKFYSDGETRCQQNDCPCDYSWEYCEKDGRCYAETSSVLGVTITGFVILLTTVTALF